MLRPVELVRGGIAFGDGQFSDINIIGLLPSETEERGVSSILMTRGALSDR